MTALSLHVYGERERVRPRSSVLLLLLVQFNALIVAVCTAQALIFLFERDFVTIEPRKASVHMRAATPLAWATLLQALASASATLSTKTSGAAAPRPLACRLGASSSDFRHAALLNSGHHDPPVLCASPRPRLIIFS